MFNKIKATLIKLLGVRFLTMLGIDAEMFKDMSSDDAIVQITKAIIIAGLGIAYMIMDTLRPSLENK